MFIKQMISPNEFQNEMNKTINQFQEKLPIEFARTLDLIRLTSQGNALFSRMPLNWRIFPTEDIYETNRTLYTKPVSYINSEENTECTCATQKSCTMPAIMYDRLLSTPLNGFKLGCYSLETVLLSSLACFYSKTCINDYHDFTSYSFYNQSLDVVYNGTGEVIQLNSSVTRFDSNDTIETMVNELFIESWITNVSYEKFFNSCAPSYCSYKYYYRFDAFELLTIFLSVYSSLSTIIRFIVPYLFSIIRTIVQRLRIVPSQ